MKSTTVRIALTVAAATSAILTAAAPAQAGVIIHDMAFPPGPSVVAYPPGPSVAAFPPGPGVVAYPPGPGVAAYPAGPTAIGPEI